jgi:hypothetical protein
VNNLEAEARAGRQGRIPDHLRRLDFIGLDELGAGVSAGATQISSYGPRSGAAWCRWRDSICCPGPRARR